eukprot:TRINITY_DN16892_c0_g1_i1.p2 TRINITY_DN16892_c0_g1~~TRINITY_DN16892_c0_g1_i1.p2  ORF type:complete len:125 (+),score=26.48 TRINITY_DN16892_c0_g1_i1:367-741(+)
MSGRIFDKRGETVRIDDPVRLANGNVNVRITIERPALEMIEVLKNIIPALVSAKMSPIGATAAQTPTEGTPTSTNSSPIHALSSSPPSKPTNEPVPFSLFSGVNFQLRGESGVETDSFGKASAK